MITSLHSPHVAAVKALLGSRGVKERKSSKKFVVEGMQSIREAMTFGDPRILTLYITDSGRQKMAEMNLSLQEVPFDVLEVTDEVMQSMSDTVTPQGALALCELSEHSLESFLKKAGRKLAYFWEIQDPGNAGAVIRTADAFGFDGIIFSPNSVDVYSPKVVRSTAGSLWHIPVFTNVSLDDLSSIKEKENIVLFALDGQAKNDLESVLDEEIAESSIWIFGNEARGLPEVSGARKISITMAGKAESLNLAAAATVVMYALSSRTSRNEPR